MNVHRSPIGEASPIGCSSRSSDGAGNCDLMTLTAPYAIIATASTKRT